MSYFKNFPTIPYDSAGDGKLKDVTNLLRRVVVRAKVKENVTVFDTYDVHDGETPEMIAHKLYGDVNRHWVILLFNNVFSNSIILKGVYISRPTPIALSEGGYDQIIYV